MLREKLSNMSSSEIEQNKKVSRNTDISIIAPEEKKNECMKSQYPEILQQTQNAVFLTETLDANRRRKSESPPYIQRQKNTTLLHPGTLRAKAKSIERAVDVEKSPSVMCMDKCTKHETKSSHNSKSNIDNIKQEIQLETISNSSLHPNSLTTDSRMHHRRKSDTPYFQLHAETPPSLLPFQRRQSEAPPAIFLRTGQTTPEKKLEENRRQSVATTVSTMCEITNSIPESLNRLAIGKLE